MSLIRINSCRSCSNCVMLQGVPQGEPQGECHGGPPQVVAVAVTVPGTKQQALSIQTMFPRVHLDMSCGIWKPKIVASPPN